MIRSTRILQKSMGSNGRISRGLGKTSYAVLYPSTIPIFPFQTFLTSIKESDRANLQKLGIKSAAAFYLKNSEDEKITAEDTFSQLVAASKKEAVDLEEQEQ